MKKIISTISSSLLTEKVMIDITFYKTFFGYISYAFHIAEVSKISCFLEREQTQFIFYIKNSNFQGIFLISIDNNIIIGHFLQDSLSESNKCLNQRNGTFNTERNVFISTSQTQSHNS